MYTKEEEAIYFMTKAFKNQKSKTTNVEKAFHSIIVGNSIKNITKVEDVIVAAYLHGIIQDTEYGYEDIEERFGTLVADIVYEISEDLAIAKWLDRQKNFVKRLKKTNDINVINIIIADKLQRLNEYYDIYLKKEDKMWSSFGGSKEDNCWLYREIYNIGLEKDANKLLLARYKKMLTIYFGDSNDEEKEE